MTRIHEVTNDPDLLRDIRAKLDELGSYEVVAYAHSLGLFPPGYREGQTHTISEYWPPGYDGEEGLIVWDVGFDSPDPSQPQATDDGDDTWEGIVPVDDNPGDG